VAEGLETGLSIAQVVDAQHIIASLGKHNLKYLNKHNLGNKIVLCIDNDGNATFADKSIARAVLSLLDQDKTVYVSMPSEENTDFNDVLLGNYFKSQTKHDSNNSGGKSAYERGREELILSLSQRRPWQEIPELASGVEKIRLQREKAGKSRFRDGPFQDTDDVV